MGKLIGLAVVIANIMATLELVKGSKEKKEMLIWLLVVWCIPGLGAILYFTIGKK